MVNIGKRWRSSDSRNWLQLRISQNKRIILLLFNNFYIFILFFSIQSYLIKSIEGFSSSSLDSNSRSPDTQLISDILNKLTNPSRYDKRLRPMYGKKPVDVGITIHVSSISAVSEVDMDFTLDFYLRQSWRDDRLAFGELDDSFKEIKSLTVGVDYLDKLWKPDTFFPNEKKSFFHTATTHNSFLRIDPDGTVFTSQRLTVTATCPMKLKLFPMDSQKCKLEIESYGYTTADIDYFWGSKRGVEESNIVKFDNFSLPQFKRTAYKMITAKATTSSGSYIRLKVQITFTRQIGFYLMNIIVPSILIVTISWVSFWLDRGSSPARTGLGVTTVLTETTLITTTNNSMPKVSYIKGLDVYLNFCFIMVFASLVEYAVVSYMNKKLAQKRDKKRRKQEQAQTAEIPMFGNYNVTPYNNNPTKTLISHPEIPSDCDCRTIPMVQAPRFVPDNIMWPGPFIKAKKATRTCRTITPSKIDRCSRSVFPIIFIIFNLGYWTIMTILSQQEMQLEADDIEFND